MTEAEMQKRLEMLKSIFTKEMDEKRHAMLEFQVAFEVAIERLQKDIDKQIDERLVKTFELEIESAPADFEVRN